MKRALSTWNRPPRQLRRTSVRLENLALVPASELPSLDLWQQRARQLPPGNTLVVLPSDNVKLRQVGRKIQLTLEKQGRRSLIATIPASSPPQS